MNCGNCKSLNAHKNLIAMGFVAATGLSFILGGIFGHRVVLIAVGGLMDGGMLILGVFKVADVWKKSQKSRQEKEKWGLHLQKMQKKELLSGKFYLVTYKNKDKQSEILSENSINNDLNIETKELLSGNFYLVTYTNGKTQLIREIPSAWNENVFTNFYEDGTTGERTIFK